MKRFSLMLLLFAATAAQAAPALYKPGEWKWTVSSGKTVVGKATVKTDGAKVRVDWAPAAGSQASFIAADGKVWVKGDKKDADFSTVKGAVERAVIPPLLLPTVTAKGDKFTSDAKGISAYTYGANSAKYAWDAKGPQTITVTAGGKSYLLTRDAVTTTPPAASAFAINKGTSRLGQLTQLAGTLTSPSDRDAGASAGAAGVGEGTKLDSKGDYDQLAELETRDEEAEATRAAELKKFQKEGKVGKAGGAK